MSLLIKRPGRFVLTCLLWGHLWEFKLVEQTLIKKHVTVQQMKFCRRCGKQNPNFKWEEDQQ